MPNSAACAASESDVEARNGGPATGGVQSIKMVLLKVAAATPAPEIAALDIDTAAPHGMATPVTLRTVVSVSEVVSNALMASSVMDTSCVETIEPLLARVSTMRCHAIPLAGWPKPETHR